MLRAEKSIWTTFGGGLLANNLIEDIVYFHLRYVKAAVTIHGPRLAYIHLFL